MESLISICKNLAVTPFLQTDMRFNLKTLTISEPGTLAS